jgi:hypothetical protein
MTLLSEIPIKVETLFLGIKPLIHSLFSICRAIKPQLLLSPIKQLGEIYH